MKIDKETGKIGYHSFQIQDDLSIDFVQYGFDGKELYRTKFKSEPPSVIEYSS